MKPKRSRILIYSVCVFLLLVYFGNRSGYVFSESKALKEAYPRADGEAVYHQAFGKDKIVIWKMEDMDFVKLVTKKWGFLYHVTETSPLAPSANEPNTIQRTWSAQLNANKMYDIIFAFSTINPEIKRVIISNDNFSNVEEDNLEFIKSDSTVYIELPVRNGYAVSYLEINPKDNRGFVFRGMDNNGHLIAATR